MTDTKKTDDKASAEKAKADEKARNEKIAADRKAAEEKKQSEADALKEPYETDSKSADEATPEKKAAPSVSLPTSSNGLRTSDSDDPQKAWTVQDVDNDDKDSAYVTPEGEPGQYFFPNELPSRKAMESAHLDWEATVGGLPVIGDVDDTKDDSKSDKRKK